MALWGVLVGVSLIRGSDTWLVQYFSELEGPLFIFFVELDGEDNQKMRKSMVKQTTQSGEKVYWLTRANCRRAEKYGDIR